MRPSDLDWHVLLGPLPHLFRGSAGSRSSLVVLGGRFEPDGSFRGTRWLTVAEDPGKVDELEWQATKSEPSSADLTGLRTLVAELIRRAP